MFPLMDVFGRFLEQWAANGSSVGPLSAYVLPLGTSVAEWEAQRTIEGCGEAAAETEY